MGNTEVGKHCKIDSFKMSVFAVMLVVTCKYSSYVSSLRGTG